MKVKTLIAALSKLPKDLDVEFKDMTLSHYVGRFMDLKEINCNNVVLIHDSDVDGKAMKTEEVEILPQKCTIIFES